MDLYELVVLVHIGAAFSLLSGSVIASPHVRRVVRRARTVQEMRAYLAIGRPLLILEPVSAVVVLASGVHLTSVAHFWTQGWVQVAVAFWVVNSVVAATLVKPAIGRLASQAVTSPDGPVGNDLDAFRWSLRWSFGGDLLMANDATMLYLMAMKPGLAGSLLAVAAANVVVSAVGAGLRLHRTHVGAGLTSAA
jgi:hypothetical protein